jgi:hypothetical protein
MHSEIRRQIICYERICLIVDDVDQKSIARYLIIISFNIFITPRGTKMNKRNNILLS